MASKTRTKSKGTKKAAPLDKTFEANPIAQAIVKGYTVERKMDYGRVVVDGRTVGQVAARKDYVVLERLHEGTKVPAAIEPTGKDGKIRGRFKVTEKQVGQARKVIEASAKLVAKDAAKAKSDSKPKASSSRKPTTRDRVLSGKLADTAAANPDLAERAKEIETKAKRQPVGVKVEA